jgi:hypothetical protein
MSAEERLRGTHLACSKLCYTFFKRLENLKLVIEVSHVTVVMSCLDHNSDSKRRGSQIMLFTRRSYSGWTCTEERSSGVLVSFCQSHPPLKPKEKRWNSNSIKIMQIFKTLFRALVERRYYLKCCLGNKSVNVTFFCEKKCHHHHYHLNSDKVTHILSIIYIYIILALL